MMVHCTGALEGSYVTATVMAAGSLLLVAVKDTSTLLVAQPVTVSVVGATLGGPKQAYTATARQETKASKE